ncbi:MAG: hypothetical protein HXX16_01935 [Bacteroidales bacterium]|nr:hypothetical protein [Bacteroidales bacterium]
MKNLKELKGVKVLSKAEQKVITGGLACEESADCLVIGKNCCINQICTLALPPYHCKF